jgi:glycerophosphoryl diester phosphodiesterase
VAAHPLIIAHRGASHDAPENSMAAFRLALAQGADMIELDVRASADHRLVVVHDPTTAHWEQPARRVADLALPALRVFDLGDGERIPLLDDVCAWAAATQVRLNIELKVAGFEAATIALVRHYNLVERVVVSSFLTHVLVALHAQAPDIARGVLTDVEVGVGENALEHGSPLPLLRRLAAHAWHPASAQLHHAAQVQAVRAAGYRVYVWTVDDVERARRLLAWGVDGIITNQPAQLRAAVL